MAKVVRRKAAKKVKQPKPPQAVRSARLEWRQFAEELGLVNLAEKETVVTRRGLDPIGGNPSGRRSREATYVYSADDTPIDAHFTMQIPSRSNTSYAVGVSLLHPVPASFLYDSLAGNRQVKIDEADLNKLPRGNTAVRSFIASHNLTLDSVGPALRCFVELARSSSEQDVTAYLSQAAADAEGSEGALDIV